ncbi:MAG: response regulator transcription factor [Clostridia bacterium]|nr:response regulator transcription factor [Clostridia bacterium]
MSIRVMIVDDQPLLAEGIKSVLEHDDQLTVAAIAGDGAEALEKLAKEPADVVLMDVRMPNMNGVIATKEIKARYPDVKVVVLTTFDDSDYILNAINNGASGYLLKDIGSAKLIEAVKNAYAGDTILPAKIAKRITDAAIMVSENRELKLKKTFSLSDRETDIAIMLQEGFTNRQIAAAFKLTDGTARNYISALYVKLGVDNRAAAIKKLSEVLQRK